MRIKVILFFLFLVNITVSGLATSDTLRVPVGTKDDTFKRTQLAAYEISSHIKILLQQFIANIGNRPIPTAPFLSFNLELFIRRVKNSDLFIKTYGGNWEEFTDDLLNNHNSPAYGLFIKSLLPEYKTYVYRYPEQHRYIKETIPQLLEEKIRKRKGNKPIYIKLVTFGGGYDPVSLGTTLIETIKTELQSKYPELTLGKDILVEITDIEIDPLIIKRTKIKLREKNFTIKDTKYTPYNTLLEHTKQIRRNSEFFLSNINFIQGSIADKKIVGNILKESPDFIICNNCFYQLDIQHQINFINFLGQNSLDTTFIFAFSTNIISSICDTHSKRAKDTKITLRLKPTEKKPYPPLFETYFDVTPLEKVDIQYGNTLVMKKKPFIIPETKTEFYVYELTDNNDIIMAIDKWFSQNKNRHFKRQLWDGVTFCRGSLIQIVSKDEEILGMAYIRKENDFWFSYDIENWAKNSAFVYEIALLEISPKYRDKKLGRLLIATACRKSLSDPDIKQKVIITKPRHDEKVYDFYKKAETIPVYISFGYPDNSHVFYYFLLNKNSAQELIKTTYRHFLRAAVLRKNKAAWSAN